MANHEYDMEIVLAALQAKQKHVLKCNHFIEQELNNWEVVL